jgi:protein involved in temperature-dependent protein secretion
MAVSDALADAVESIRQQMRANPEAYAHRKAWIDLVLFEMDELRADLDGPAPVDHRLPSQIN